MTRPALISEDAAKADGLNRVALGVAYDGASWHGWQTQPGGQTVQDRVQEAIKVFTGSAFPTVCAGRTDAGVHALCQVVHLDVPFVREPHAWVHGLNRYLPPSIAVQWAKPVVQAFHARFSATTRTYTYVILNTPVRHPLWASRAGWCFKPLDVTRMQRAAQSLLGQHDFSSFRSAQCQAASPVRTMYDASVQRHGMFVILQFRANAFLHHMIRNLVGELVYIGLGRRDLTQFEAVFKACDRKLAAPTYSANGLYLMSVSYPEALLQMPSVADIESWLDLPR